MKNKNANKPLIDENKVVFIRVSVIFRFSLIRATNTRILCEWIEDGELIKHAIL